MEKTYTFGEFRWKFLSREVDRFDLRKLYDKGRYLMRQVLKEIEESKGERMYEEREIRGGHIVKILRIDNTKNSGSSYALKNAS